MLYDPIVDAGNFPKEIELVPDVPTVHFDMVVTALKHRDTDAAAFRQLSPVFIEMICGAVEVTGSTSTRH